MKGTKLIVKCISFKPFGSKVNTKIQKYIVLSLKITTKTQTLSNEAISQ